MPWSLYRWIRILWTEMWVCLSFVCCLFVVCLFVVVCSLLSTMDQNPWWFDLKCDYPPWFVPQLSRPGNQFGLGEDFPEQLNQTTDLAPDPDIGFPKAQQWDFLKFSCRISFLRNQIYLSRLLGAGPVWSISLWNSARHMLAKSSPAHMLSLSPIIILLVFNLFLFVLPIQMFSTHISVSLSTIIILNLAILVTILVLNLVILLFLVVLPIKMFQTHILSLPPNPGSDPPTHRRLGSDANFPPDSSSTSQKEDIRSLIKNHKGTQDIGISTKEYVQGWKIKKWNPLSHCDRCTFQLLSKVLSENQRCFSHPPQRSSNGAWWGLVFS